MRQIPSKILNAMKEIYAAPAVAKVTRGVVHHRFGPEPRPVYIPTGDYPSNSASITISPPAVIVIVNTLGRQQTEQSSMYFCLSPPEGSTKVSFSSPQYAQVYRPLLSSLMLA